MSSRELEGQREARENRGRRRRRRKKDLHYHSHPLAAMAIQYNSVFSAPSPSSCPNQPGTTITNSQQNITNCPTCHSGFTNKLIYLYQLPPPLKSLSSSFKVEIWKFGFHVRVELPSCLFFGFVGPLYKQEDHSLLPFLPSF